MPATLVRTSFNGTPMAHIDHVGQQRIGSPFGKTCGSPVPLSDFEALMRIDVLIDLADRGALEAQMPVQLTEAV